MGSLTVTFWPGYCHGQGKVAFGISFVWIVSILMRTQTIINLKMSHIFYLRRFPCFTFFASALPWSMKNDILQAYWQDLVGIYQYAKNYQNITNSLSAMTVFAN